jgi:hypothetical protein
MSDDATMHALRLMAWERAKGELGAILQTYFGGDSRFDTVSDEFTKFIARIEDNGIGGLG